MTVQTQICRPPVHEFKNLDWISTTIEDPIIQDKWYTPLVTTRDIKAWYLIVEQTNNGAAAETIQVELTIDGTTYTATTGQASGTQYFIVLDADGGLQANAATVYQVLTLDADQSAPLETKSLQIRVRQTTAVDAVAAQIEVNMVYEAVEQNASVAPLVACRVPEYANLDWISTTVDAIVVQNKWYTPFPTQKNVKGYYLIFEQTNNGAANEDIETELTINGVVYTETSNIASGAQRYIGATMNGALGDYGSPRPLLTLDYDQSVPLETKSLQIRVRQTSAVDAIAANIEVNMVYVLQDENQTTEPIHEYKNVDWISTSVDAIVVQDKWYTPLPMAYGVKAWYLIVEQTNNGAAVETLECELTINGIVYTATLAGIASGSQYYIVFDSDGVIGNAAAGVVQQLLALDLDQSAPLETKSLQVRVRQTTAVDAVAANIEVNLVYAVLQENATVLPQLALATWEYKNLDYDTSGIANPIVINTWYTALETVLDANAWYLIVEQTNNGAAAEDIEVELTINGTIVTATLAALADGTPNYISGDIIGGFNGAAAVNQLLSLDADQSAPLETKSLRIRVRQTSAVDAVSAVIEVNMVYAQKENIW